MAEAGALRRGDVVLAELSFPSAPGQSKVRPAVIIQNDLGNRFSDLTIVAPITSKYDTELYPTEVLVEAPEGGLTVDSVVLLNQIRSIDRQRLIRRLAGCGKTLRSPFDGLRANGRCHEIIEYFPFMLSLSKHENHFSATC